jgi:hypothetical protein
MTTRSAEPSAATTRTAALAFAADAACVLLFCTVGRRNHAEAVTLAGVAETAWPFLAGLTASWLLYRAWRQPTAVRPTGVTLWLGTIGIGMVLRAGIGAGVALSFVLVATLVTGVLLLGWRAAVTALAGRAGR